MIGSKEAQAIAIYASNATPSWEERSAEPPAPQDRSGNDLSFEPDLLVRPVAERLVLRAPAATEPRFRAAPALEPAAGDERQVPDDLERPVLQRFDLELTALHRQAFAQFAHGAGIIELRGLMAVVAERL